MANTFKSPQSAFLVKYNKSDDTEVLTDLIESGTFQDNANGEADTITLTVNNQKNKWLKGFFPKPKDYVKVWIQTKNWFDDGSQKQYCGKFMIDQMTISGGNGASVTEIEGISTPIKMSFAVTQKNKKWSKSTFKEVAQKIAKKAKIKLVYKAGSVSTDEITQDSTDMEFLFSMASKYGLGMKLFNKKVIIYDLKRYEKKKAKLTIDKSDVESFEFTNKVMSKYNAVKLKNDNVEYNFKMKNTKGNRKLFLSDDCENIKNAEKIAKAALRKSRRENYKVSLVMRGNPSIYATMNIKLTGFGKENGKYFVDSVTHELDGAYTTTVEAHKVVTSF